MALWVSTWKLPDISAFRERKTTESTKIYDRTGEILLYDLNAGAKRTIIPYTDIARNIKNATVAIEDDTFWQHRGIRPESFLRAIFANLGSISFSQGGSTITQQVVKNSLLTPQKTIARKIKEWVLAWKLEQVLNKEEILALYLNEAPYGGTIYGIEEASRGFFGKKAVELSIAESAYLAALPNAPTFYSPYGNHKDKLEERKNVVLKKMLENKFITDVEYIDAKKEVVCFPSTTITQDSTKIVMDKSISSVKEKAPTKCTSAFKPQEKNSILAPHFVFFVRQYLEEKYGQEALEHGGFKVITTLDYELQKIAEETVKKYALENKEKFDAENAALVALDPKTGQILAMVGSRDYFDKEIDGNFNTTIALRQPGSAFKPFVYAAAFSKGFTPETIVFDVQTEFSTECNPDGTPIIPENEDKCYMPVNYDGKYHGPISLRDALAQSINIPAIKVLYLAGLKESLRLAKDMGLKTLTNTDQYGLTLVLGGGEVKLLELTNAYGVFAAEGMRRESTSILRVETNDGTTIENWADAPERVLDETIARTVTDILSDNKARTPAFSATSPLYFPSRDVAAKTGTTNDYRDAWILGYTPNLVVGAWAGNNDNHPMQKKVAAFIVAPLWNDFMNNALLRVSAESFKKPAEENLSALPPVIRGIWQGGVTYFVDKLSGALATQFTPQEFREERAVREIHSILFWVDKNNPRAFRNSPPETDPQFSHWEYTVRKWAEEQKLFDETATSSLPITVDNLHKPEFFPIVTFASPRAGISVSFQESIKIRASASAHFPVVKVNFFLNNSFIGSSNNAPWELLFSPKDFADLPEQNELKAVAYDVVGNKGESTVVFSISN